MRSSSSFASDSRGNPPHSTRRPPVLSDLRSEGRKKSYSRSGVLAPDYVGERLPTISRFYGVVIRMFHNDHAPPHFHAEYAEAVAAISIERLEVIAGMLPPRALLLVLDWAELHKQELLENWELCLSKKQPNKIQPLA